MGRRRRWRGPFYLFLDCLILAGLFLLVVFLIWG